MAELHRDHMGLVDWGVLLAFNNEIEHTYLSLLTVGENLFYWVARNLKKCDLCTV